MQVISAAALGKMERFYRANLINSISGFKPVALIGTQNKSGQTNLALFSSIVHLGADPALIGFIQRPVGQSGDTFRNIQENPFYTINLVPQDILVQAHYTSARFPSDVSEFDACGLTETYESGFPAPFVNECPVKIGLQLVEVIPIRHNNTQLVIGKVELLLFAEALLQPDGNIALHEAGLLAVSGLETYHKPVRVASLPYAKVENVPFKKESPGPL